MTKEKIVKLVEGKEKIQNITIQFEEFDPATYHNDPMDPPIYDEKVCEDIRGYQVNGDLFAVSFKDDSSFIVPMRRIRSILVTFTDKE